MTASFTNLVLSLLMSSELHQYITTTYLVPMKSRDWINGALITFHLLLGLRLFCWTLRGRPGFPALPLTSFPAGFWLGMASRWGQQVRGEMGWVFVPCAFTAWLTNNLQRSRLHGPCTRWAWSRHYILPCPLSTMVTNSFSLFLVFGHLDMHVWFR